MKLTLKDLNLDFSQMSEDEAKFAKGICGIVVDAINKGIDGVMSQAEVEKQISGAIGKLGENDTIKQLKADLEEQKKVAKKAMEALEKMQQKGVNTDAVVEKVNAEVDKLMESEQWKSVANGNYARGEYRMDISLKDIVSITDNYTGSALHTGRGHGPVAQAGFKKLHMRDIMTVVQGDPENLSLAWPKIYDIDKNARYVSENGTLPASSFKMKEEIASVTRLGTHIQLSKRMLKSKVYVRSFVLAMMPQAVRDAEDFDLLYGDGSGNHVTGIKKTAGVLPVETIIGSAIITGAAGAVDSVEPYGPTGSQKIIVNLAKSYDALQDGMLITFASASNTNLNATFPVIKLNDKQLLVDIAYVAEATPGSITFTVNSGAYHSIDLPNSEDVVNTIVAVMTYAQWTPNFIALNPLTVNAIASEKDSLGRSLDIVKVVNGVKYIGTLPVIEMTSIPMGDYFVGDMNRGAQLVEYTGLILEWAEDVTTKLTNSIELIAQEEIIFPVYNPWAFSFGSLASVKTAITKPSN